MKKLAITMAVIAIGTGGTAFAQDGDFWSVSHREEVLAKSAAQRAEAQRQEEARIASEDARVAEAKAVDAARAREIEQRAAAKKRAAEKLAADRREAERLAASRNDTRARAIEYDPALFGKPARPAYQAPLLSGREIVARANAASARQAPSSTYIPPAKGSRGNERSSRDDCNSRGDCSADEFVVKGNGTPTRCGDSWYDECDLSVYDTSPNTPSGSTPE